MKKLVSILLMLFAAAILFAETEKKSEASSGLKTIPMYAKLEAGYSGGIPVKVLTYSNTFALKPVFGISPFQNIPRLSFEASFGLDFGGYLQPITKRGYSNYKYVVSVNRITPMIGALWTISSFKKFDIYTGLGMGMTIQFLNDFEQPENNDISARFVTEIMIGTKIKITEKISANAEFYIALPGIYVYGIRAGATYRFK